MPHIADEQYIFDKKGSPVAVIIPIEEYKKFLSVLEEIGYQSETELLSQSPEFAKLVRSGLEDIRSGRTRHWREVWDEI
ncbi:hypothetical protein [Desulfonema magnum]|uniref:Antitoxin n=1 Tax=Desulfonema magnum TaxID=45655 RepID=A0A975BIM0_9BACT|nr:hypothetical protein [Desulfonema magnum]QTA86028.1 Uncharacterized protein dnm_020460 [Desulfonema magnum]